MLVRTWNLFHGNTQPPQRRAFLREMVELVTADDPDVVCLQELPLWALPFLERWSGMRHVSAVARRPRFPFGRWPTELHHGLLRSALTGEAGAILAARRYRLSDEREAVVSETGLRRVVHGVRLDGDLFVANAHITGEHRQLERVLAFVEDEPRVIVCGDFNLRGEGLPGFSTPLADSIDQILVRGLPAAKPFAWPVERRRTRAGVLSDHAPIELLAG
ncbi:MAG TPA: endonuclease/exonuclease/phosphatase family protein [Gaiellaceae bacterium]|nr:endonuclease/exonuclease/phosphatase family protein [Gaiellaceae bacterium]